MQDVLACPRETFFSRHDPLDPRLGDLVNAGTPTRDSVTLLGYPDDEGIKLNGGRLGAKEGPQTIRHWLYRMTPHARRELRPFFDLGDLNTSGSLDERHERGVRVVEGILTSPSRLLSLGGGNDYAYCDGLAFLKARFSGRPLIINVDAHLDVRDLTHGPTSGTPFYRLLESGFEFDLIEFGIQGQCTSKHHSDYARAKGSRLITLDEIVESPRSMLDTLMEHAGDWLTLNRPTYLSIDIDAFAWPYAIGASQSWPLGLLAHEFWPLYLTLLRRLNVRAMGIFEVSPPLEVQSGTSKWAAQLAHGFLHHV